MVQALAEDGLFGSTFATPGDIDNYDIDLRVNNSVNYVPPNMRGNFQCASEVISELRQLT